MENKMNQKSNMVRFYDSKTKTYHSIPASELASDMILCKEEGNSEEPAWEHISHIERNNKFLHPEFDEETKETIRMIQKDVAEICYQTEKEWEDGFRRDEHPMNEISHWVIIGETYQDAVTHEHYTNGQKRDLLKIIIQCSCSQDAEAIYHVVDPRSFTKELAVMLINRSIYRRKLLIEEARKGRHGASE
jgi:DNA-directed RNA polymerase beta' subunit